MVDLSEIQAAYYMVAATGVLVAAIYYVATLRTTQKNLKANLDTRQTQVFMQLVDKALSNWPLYNEILNKWSWKDYEDCARALAIMHSVVLNSTSSSLSTG